uniref:ethanolamine kinase n=1 Tax=Junco hyemalis TaxID=40217 RepID=A0A8C5IFT4_JUNHY
MGTCSTPEFPAWSWHGGDFLWGDTSLNPLSAPEMPKIPLQHPKTGTGTIGQGFLVSPLAVSVPTQLFTDGITNKLVACYTDEGMGDALLVRVYGRKTELLVDRETELRNFQVLRAHGCAPDLYCAFQNGLCYQFLPGIALGPDHVRDPHIFSSQGNAGSQGSSILLL